MKKLSIIILSTVLILILSACSAGNRASDAVSASESTTAAAEAPADLAAAAEAAADPGQTPMIAAYDPGLPALANDAESTVKTELLTSEQAIAIALDDAGLNAHEVYDLKAETDEEYSGIYWDVEFGYDEFEYSYVIDAESGNIVRSYIDTES